MGKDELYKRIIELSRTEKSKVDIYNQLEQEVPEKQKHWLIAKIISAVKPELIIKYKPFNHSLLLLLIVQYIFSFYIFVTEETQFILYQIILTVMVTLIYLALMLGIYKVKLFAYNALIVLCSINIVFSLIYLITSSWKDVLISDAINVGQIIYAIWLQNRLFPEVKVFKRESRVKNNNILSHP